MAIRITKIVRETVQKYGAANARITQYVQEALIKNGVPNVRATQIAREVLINNGIPNIRLTQCVREVLCRINYYVDNLNLWQDAVSTSLSSISTGNTLTLSDSFTLSDSTALQLNTYLSLSDTLTLSDQVQLLSPLQTALSDTLSLSDGVAYQVGIPRSLSDGFTLTDALSKQAKYFAVLSDSFTLTDQFSSNYVYQPSFGDTLNFSDSVSRAITGANFVDTLVFSDSVSRSTSIVTIALSTSVSDTFTLIDTLGRSFIGSQIVIVTDDIFRLTDSLRLSYTFPALIDTLTLSDSFVVTLGYNVIPSTSFDTMQYNWSDTLQVSYAYGWGVALGDNLNLWNDAVRIFGVSPRTLFEDSMIQYDSISTFMTFSLGLFDFLSMSDSLGLSSSTGRIEDSMLMTDAVNVSMFVGTSILLSDSMFNMVDNLPSDKVSLRPYGDIDYYRRYLGDVYKRVVGA